MILEGENDWRQIVDRVCLSQLSVNALSQDERIAILLSAERAAATVPATPRAEELFALSLRLVSSDVKFTEFVESSRERVHSFDELTTYCMSRLCWLDATPPDITTDFVAARLCAFMMRSDLECAFNCHLFLKSSRGLNDLGPVSRILNQVDRYIESGCLPPLSTKSLRTLTLIDAQH